MRHTVAGAALIVLATAAATTLEMAGVLNDAFGSWLVFIGLGGAVSMFIGVIAK